MFSSCLSFQYGCKNIYVRQHFLPSFLYGKIGALSKSLKKREEKTRSVREKTSIKVRHLKSRIHEVFVTVI